ncbi:MAG: hypothetical protein WCE90_09670 [Candidatus Zixiibacteriota bacterium]
MRNAFSVSGSTLVTVVVWVCVILCSSFSFAQVDQFGNPDTCRIKVLQDLKSNRAMASVSVFNDEKLAAMTIPFRFGDGKTPIRCDSVRFRGTRVADFDMKSQLIDSVRQTVLVGLISDMSGSKGPLDSGDGETFRMYFTLAKNQKFQDFYLDTAWVKPYNVLKFVTPDVKGIFPVFDNSRALIKGGIPLASPTGKKPETPPKSAKETSTEKPSGSTEGEKK